MMEPSRLLESCFSTCSCYYKRTKGYQGATMSLFDAHRRCTRVRLRHRCMQRLCFDYTVPALLQLRLAPPRHRLVAAPALHQLFRASRLLIS
jgi:hypothetical protein